MLKYIVLFPISLFCIRYTYRKTILFLIKKNNYHVPDWITYFISLKNTNINELVINSYYNKIKFNNLPGNLSHLLINKKVDKPIDYSNYVLPRSISNILLIGENYNNLYIPNSVNNLQCNINCLQNITLSSLNVLVIDIENQNTSNINLDLLPGNINKLYININEIYKIDYNPNNINNKFNKLYLFVKLDLYNYENILNLVYCLRKNKYDNILDEYNNIKVLYLYEYKNNKYINCKINKLIIENFDSEICNFPNTLTKLKIYDINKNKINLSNLNNLICFTKYYSYIEKRLNNHIEYILPDSLQYLCINKWPINYNIPSNLRFLVIISNEHYDIDLNIEKIIIDTEFKKEYKYKNLIKFSKYH